MLAITYSLSLFLSLPRPPYLSGHHSKTNRKLTVQCNTEVNINSANPLNCKLNWTEWPCSYAKIFARTESRKPHGLGAWYRHLNSELAIPTQRCWNCWSRQREWSCYCDFYFCTPYVSMSYMHFFSHARTHKTGFHKRLCLLFIYNVCLQFSGIHAKKKNCYLYGTVRW